MFRVTRFCVQPYVRTGVGLVPEESARFHQPAEAIGVAERMGRRVAGVAVFRVDGWPVQDLWGEPRLLWKTGEVPPPPYRRFAA